MPDVPASDRATPAANERVPKKGLLTGKYKWYVIGGLAAVAVLVFAFVRKSNANAGSSSGSGATTLDPSTQAALQNALQAQGAAYSSGQVTGPQGSPGPQGPAGPAGPSGPAGKSGGGGTVTVPKVIGMTATAAKVRLAASGLIAGSEGKNGGGQKVNSQTPGAGAKVAIGSTVNLGLVGGNPKVPASAANMSSVTVKPGQSLNSIAAAHNVPVATLHSVNKTVVGNNPGSVTPGMRLNVP